MINKKKLLAVIPARYGSKRLKKKNLLQIKKKSLIEHTYQIAKKSKYIDEIIICTESEIIKKKISHIIEKKKIIMRPRYLSKSNISGSKVVTHLLKKKNNYDFVILLQPTSPLRTTNDIDKSIYKTYKSKIDSLVSVYKSKRNRKFPVSIINNRLSKPKKFKKGNKFNHYLNGAIYISKVKSILKNKSFFSKNTGFYLMPESRSIDIDFKKEFLKAKKIIEKNAVQNY